MGAFTSVSFWVIAAGMIFGLGLACQAKGQSCHNKKSALAKIFMEKKRVKVQ